MAVVWYALGGRTWPSMPWGVGVLAGIVVAGLLAYLVYALIRPERF